MYLRLKSRIGGTFKRLISKMRSHGIIEVVDNGVNNRIILENKVDGRNLTIIFRGSNNEVHIGYGCKFYGEGNKIFIGDDNNRIFIGRETTFDQRVLLVACEETAIHIGRDCQFAAGVTIRTSDQHPIYDCVGKRINPAKDITIGDHVWLGANVVIMKNIQIGGGAMVGYGSMVTKSLPENCIAVGSPIKVIKEDIRWERTFR